MRNRWLVAAAGTISMICLGTVYSWSIFTQPLVASFGWSNTTTTWAFAWAIFFLGAGAVIGGRWQDRVGPRRVAITGVLLWGLGNLLAGLGTATLGPWWIYLTYGLIGGLGLGIGYVTPVAAVTKWFPDMRGVGSGMVVMGFGLGAFFYSNIVKLVHPFAAASQRAAALLAAKSAAAAAGTPFDAARYAMRPEDVGAIMSVFVVSGIIFMVLGGICASLVVNPPPGYTRPGVKALAASTGRDYSPSEAARTPQFYSLWLMLFLNVTAGILFISNAVPIMRELTGVVPGVALGVYGVIAVFNGLGRFFWGSVSDRIGRNLAYVLLYGIQVVIFFSVGHMHALAPVAILFAIVLLCYGGGFGTMPSFTADYFGTKHMGVNYGWILLAWGVAGVAGPIFVAYVKDHTGSFAGALVYVAVMLIAATVLPIVTRKPGATPADHNTHWPFLHRAAHR
ncbi:MAG TPA: OFA family MFS transporter [Anaeromyxobacteraceae bacterium]|nr:OFA family MFS transporter [Anaeromyxobacteraceae bacterium]